MTSGKAADLDVGREAFLRIGPQVSTLTRTRFWFLERTRKWTEGSNLKDDQVVRQMNRTWGLSLDVSLCSVTLEAK